MSIYSFTQDAKVYVVYGGNQYNIDISAISFSNSIAVDTYTVKTIHEKKLFEQVIIDKLNPATFELTFSAIRESDFVILFNRSLDYVPFDLYITTRQDVFKLTNCVITNTTFIATKNNILGLGISGEASLLTRAGTYGSFSIPGTIIPRSGTKTHNRLTFAQVILNEITDYDSLVTINIELQNEVKWLDYKTLDDVCATAAGTLTYPQEYKIEKQILAGSYSTNKLIDASYGLDVPLYIKIGQVDSSIFYGFEFNLAKISYTSRVSTGEIFSQFYDWRLLPPVDSLHELIKYRTITGGSLQPLLDENNIPILDENDEPIYVMI